MARWRAYCRLGQSEGSHWLEVDANTSAGAAQLFKRIYGAERVQDIREVRSNSDGSSSSSSNEHVWFGLLVLAILFVMFMPWITSIAGGAFGAWTSGKILGKNLNDAMDENKDKIVGLILLTSIIFGGVGYVKGTQWQKEFNTETVPENTVNGTTERKSVN